MINFTTLFTRLGKFAKVLGDTRVLSSSTLSTDMNNILAQFGATASDESIIDGASAALSTGQGAVDTINSWCQSAATNCVNTTVANDNLLLSYADLTASLTEVVRQMKLSGDTVKKCTVGSTVTAGSSNLGNAVVVVSTKRGDGIVNEQTFAENVTLSCVSDQDTGSTAGSESWTINGQAQNKSGNDTGWDWPGGSGQTSSTISVAADGALSLLTNGSFDGFTGTVPKNWAIVTGGTQVQQSTGTVYQGAGSLQYIGDGTTLTCISQQFGISTGTIQSPTYETQYAINCWVRVDVVAAQTGVLVVELVDGNGAVINDYSGTPNTFSLTLSGLTANTWTDLNGVFRVPQIVPPIMKIRLRLSTALKASSNLYVDSLCMAQMTQFYTGGPSFTVFSGNVATYINDFYTAAMTNDRGGAANMNNLQTACDRYFSMRELGLILPSSATPTQPDSLIS